MKILIIKNQKQSNGNSGAEIILYTLKGTRNNAYQRKNNSDENKCEDNSNNYFHQNMKAFRGIFIILDQYINCFHYENI